jgi:dipeptidyl aminopeptidase/acylaminoacyl peptidase
MVSSSGNLAAAQVPAEGHELSRSGSPRHRVPRFEAILEWFGRYLA